MKVERTIRVQWRLIGGCVTLLSAVIGVTWFSGKCSGPQTSPVEQRATASVPAQKVPAAGVASTPKQETDSAGSVAKVVAPAAPTVPDAAALRAARLAANRQALRPAPKRRPKPVGSPAEATTAAPVAVPSASGLASAVVQVDGESYELFTNQVGYFDRVRVEPEQKIPVVVNLPEATEGETVVMEMEDGGLLDTGTIVKAVRLDNSRQVAFTAQMSDNGGIHRVSLRRGADLKVLDFWVGPDVPRAE